MKYFKAMLILILLITSGRYRQKWRQSTIRLSEANDAVEASLRRLETRDNGGKPKMQMLSTSIDCGESRRD